MERQNLADALKGLKLVSVSDTELELESRTPGTHYQYVIEGGKVKWRYVTSLGLPFLSYPFGEWHFLTDDEVVDLLCGPDDLHIGRWLITQQKSVRYDACKDCPLNAVCKQLGVESNG